jgi:hypothetical protein
MKVDPSGDWIPPIFRSMLYCDEHGVLWRIENDEWVAVQKMQPVSEESTHG